MSLLGYIIPDKEKNTGKKKSDMHEHHSMEGTTNP